MSVSYPFKSCGVSITSTLQCFKIKCISIRLFLYEKSFIIGANLKLHDNSIIFIDGGGYVQISEQAATKLDSFLHEITNTPQGQKVT